MTWPVSSVVTPDHWLIVTSSSQLVLLFQLGPSVALKMATSASRSVSKETSSTGGTSVGGRVLVGETLCLVGAAVLRSVGAGPASSIGASVTA